MAEDSFPALISPATAKKENSASRETVIAEKTQFHPLLNNLPILAMHYD